MQLLRLKEIIGDKKSNPPRAGIIPIGRSTWLQGVKNGRFPKPVKLGRITAWKLSDIEALIESNTVPLAKK